MNPTANKQEFITLINSNKGIIYKVCNAYCNAPEDREDLAQEIIYNLLKSFQNYKASAKFSTWMYRIALNVAISFYRKESQSLKRSAFDESVVAFDEQSDEDENVHLLFRFIGELKEMDRSIILLYLEDKSYKEIAEITGITQTNVATKVNRIKQNLKTSFLTTQIK